MSATFLREEKQHFVNVSRDTGLSTFDSDFIFIPELSCVITPWPGDFQPDGVVDFDDYSVLALAWATQTGQSRYNPVCDISVVHNSAIDMLDILVFIENWLAGF